LDFSTGDLTTFMLTARRFLLIALLPACANLTGCAGWRHTPTAHQANEPTLALSTAAELGPSEAAKTSEAVARSPELLVTRAAWQFGDAVGSLVTTPNYRLYTTVSADEFLTRLPVFYERALEHYTTALADLPRPDKRLETFLFQTRRQWQAKTQEMLPDQAEMFANLGRGGFTTRGTSVLYYIDRGGYSRDTFAIAAHEGWHQYTQQTFKHQLPIWLEEGIATYMEGYRRDEDQLPEFNPAMNYERRATLREAVARDDLIPLDDLLTRTPQSFLDDSKDALLVYYSQVWALTRFLAEGEDGRYRATLAQVLLDAAEGRLVGRMAVSDYLPSRRRGTGYGNRVGPAVVQEYFNPDLAQLEQGYREFIEQVAQESGRRNR
jgi:hypothetical protein